MPKPQPSSSPAASPQVGAELGSLVGVSISGTYSGPIPPPQLLHEFDQVIPGAAERILRMAEKQQDHRIRLESRVITSDTYRSWAGLVLGSILAVIIILSGSYLIHEGHDWAGTTLVTGTLGVVLAAFIHGVNTRRRERDSKDPARQQKKGK